MKHHEFTLILEGHTEVTSALAGHIYRDISDVSVGHSRRRVHLDFAREADSRSEAISSALADLSKLGLRANLRLSREETRANMSAYADEMGGTLDDLDPDLEWAGLESLANEDQDSESLANEEQDVDYTPDVTSGVSGFKDDPSKSWEERFRALEAHHIEETKALRENLKAVSDALDNTMKRARETYFLKPTTVRALVNGPSGTTLSPDAAKTLGDSIASALMESVKRFSGFSAGTKNAESTAAKKEDYVDDNS